MAANEADVSRYAPRFVITINGVDLSPDVSQAVTSLEIRQQLNRMSSFSCQVQDVFDGIVFRWLDSELFKFGNDVSIAIGYSNRLFPALEGKIQNIQPEFSSGTAPSFSFGGSDRGYTFLTNRGESKTFTERRDSDIVQWIAKEAGLQARIDPTSGTVPPRTKASDSTYWEFLRLLADANGYQLRLSGRTLHFARIRRTLEPMATLIWGQNLIRFRPELSTEQTVTKVISRAWDRTNREVIEATASAGDEQQRARGTRTASELRRDTEGERVLLTTDEPAESTEELQRRADAALENASNSFMRGSAEVVGAPDLWPGDCVAIAGVGKWFSGIYCIDGATHSIGVQGYSTSLSLRRNAL